MLEIDKVLQLKEEFLTYKLEVGDGMFWLFNIETGDSFKLNETSYHMLSLLDGSKSIGEIQECILDEYPDSNPDMISKDFEELIDRMGKRRTYFKKGSVNNGRETKPKKPKGLQKACVCEREGAYIPKRNHRKIQWWTVLCPVRWLSWLQVRMCLK